MGRGTNWCVPVSKPFNALSFEFLELTPSQKLSHFFFFYLRNMATFKKWQFTEKHAASWSVFSRPTQSFPFFEQTFNK